MSTNEKDKDDNDSENYIIEFDTSSNEYESDTLSNIVDNISFIITEIDEQSESSSESSSELWGELYQNKTGIKENELHELIIMYRDLFGNEKINDEKRNKLIKLVKSMIIISSKVSPKIKK